jgi:hypothetical protein
MSKNIKIKSIPAIDGVTYEAASIAVLILATPFLECPFV